MRQKRRAKRAHLVPSPLSARSARPGRLLARNPAGAEGAAGADSRVHEPSAAEVAAYLSGLADEADTRGYSFNRALIGAGEDSTDKAYKNGTDKAENPYASVALIPVPLGQLEYELAFLQHKVAGRDPEWEHRLSERLAARGELAACAHPLFEVVPGAIEPWEKTKDF